MKNKFWGILPLFCFTAALLTCSPLFAEALKSRFKSRLPIIKALKEQQIVGENNQGYLEFIGQKTDRKDVVDSENRDRRQVYSTIAGQQGTTVETVGRHRAAQIERKARSGEWLQDARGKWYRKP